MKISLRRLWFGLCAGLLMWAGCAGHHVSSRTADRLDDKVIADRVEAALHRASAGAFAGVRVSAAGGVVTLSGQVPDAAAKAKAAELAQSIQHVQSVKDNLQVRQVEQSSRPTGRENRME